MPIQLVQNKS